MKKEDAFFYTQFVKEDSFYRCTSFWAKSNKINCKSMYLDTLFIKGFGLLVRYYEDGQIRDSICYQEDSYKNMYHFYENGKLYTHLFYDEGSRSTKTEAFDESGNIILNFIYILDPGFPGGKIAWSEYIDEKHKRKFRDKEVGKAEKVIVIVHFTIDTLGNVVNVQLEKSSGIKAVDEDAIKIISNSPKWSRGIVLNKPGRFQMRQPVTYVFE